MDAQGLYTDQFDFGGMPSGTTTASAVPNPSSGGSLEGYGSVSGPKTHHHCIGLIVLGVGALFVLHKTGIRGIAAA